jgi:hypothetical protein
MEYTYSYSISLDIFVTKPVNSVKIHVSSLTVLNILLSIKLIKLDADWEMTRVWTSN